MRGIKNLRAKLEAAAFNTLIPKQRRRIKPFHSLPKHKGKPADNIHRKNYTNLKDRDMVNQISELLKGANTLQETLQHLQAGEEALLDRQADLSSANLPASIDTLNISQTAKKRSDTIMSRNFAGGREGDSTYIDAQLAGPKAARQIENQATGRVAGLLNSLGGITIGEGSNHTPAWFEMQIRRIQNAESSEASEKNLNEIKDSLERKAQESVTAKDADGNPIEQAGGSGEASPMPEIFGSNPAAARDLAAGSSPAGASAPAPEISSSAASTQSIDITV